MAKKALLKAKNPLILRFHRLMDAFAKSDDERDFYLDKVEGFILCVELDKSEEELGVLEREFAENGERYLLIPKMTFYESKKFMEGFVNEKIYDVDTKEKLLDIIQSKEARENFLEFIYDHLAELEKWQQFYVERSRIQIIEWLRSCEIHFVFEEDLDLTKMIIEKLKKHLFDAKISKDLQAARETLEAKAKIYYSNEALNPRPKRGRPPKQAIKIDLEPQVTLDIYVTVPSAACPFLFVPEISSASEVTFSARYENEAELLASLRGSARIKVDERLQILSERLESLRHIFSRFDRLKEFSPEGDEKAITSAVSELFCEEEDKKGILGVVQGFLPKRRNKTKKEKPIDPKKAKTLTPIKHKRGKRS